MQKTYGLWKIFLNYIAILCLLCCCNVASSEDSDSDSTDSESSSSSNKAQDTSNNKAPDTATAEQLTRVLSDQELNQLGAKVVRAEMMGDEVHFLTGLF